MSGKFSDQPDKTTPASGDLFPLVDVAAPATLKKIAWSNLVAAMMGAFTAVSTTVASIVRRATATEVTNGSNVDAFVAPNDLATELAKRVPHSLATAANDVLVGAAAPGSWVKKTLAEFKTILGLGSAAYVDTGATSGKVPVLDGSNKIALALLYVGGALGLVQFDAGGKYPAADGSQITNLPVGAPQNYITGLSLSRTSTTTYSLASGKARDGGDAEDITLASAMTKSLSAWAAGTGNGSLDTGAVAANTYYNVWLIKKTDRSAVDVLLSLSGTAPTMPSGYTFKRCIGRFRTTASSQIDPLSIVSANPAIGGVEWITSTRAFISPAWDSNFNVEVLGGGGAGYNGWGAGAAGGYAVKAYRGIAAGTSWTATIGTAGTTNQEAGGTSSFGSDISCVGGSGGHAWNDSAAVGGAATGGDVNRTGESAFTVTGAWNNSDVNCGEAGSSPYGNGGRGPGPSATQGIHATGYGAGGGGSGGGPTTMGRGSPGVIIVRF